MTWTTKTLVVSPTTLRNLISQGAAALGPGPRGVTITHRRMRLNPSLPWSAIGPDETHTWQVAEVLVFEGATSVKLTRRFWRD